MACIKCGKETAVGAEFCQECLTDMERHPVKQGTPVILPKRDDLPVVRHNKKRTLKPEQQVQQLRKTCAILFVITLTMAVIAAAAVALMFQLTDDPFTSLLS